MTVKIMYRILYAMLLQLTSVKQAVEISCPWNCENHEATEVPRANYLLRLCKSGLNLFFYCISPLIRFNVSSKLCKSTEVDHASISQFYNMVMTRNFFEIILSF